MTLIIGSPINLTSVRCFTVSAALSVSLIAVVWICVLRGRFSGTEEHQAPDRWLVLAKPFNDQNIVNVSLENVGIRYLEFLRLCREENLTLGFLIDVDILQCLVTTTLNCDKNANIVYYAIFQEDLGSILNHKEVLLERGWSVATFRSVAEIRKNNFRVVFRAVKIMRNYWTLSKYKSLSEGAISPFQLQRIRLNGATTITADNISGMLANLKRSTLIKCRNKLPYSGQPTSFVISDSDFDEFVHAIALFNSMDVTPLLFGGTSLGWYRHCNLIPDTTDLDIAIPISQYSSLLKQTLLTQHRFPFYWILGKPTDSLEYSLYVGNTKLDVFFVYREENSSWIGGMIVSERRKLRWVYPPLAEICTAILREHLFHIPCNVEAFIEADYGTNWLTPVPTDNFTFLSHQNVEKVGTWSKEEIEKVYITFEQSRGYWVLLALLFALCLGRIYARKLICGYDAFRRIMCLDTRCALLTDYH